MNRPLTTSIINWLVAVPLMVMSYHIYTFFETEPMVIRIALAVSFDLLVVVVFFQLKDPYIKASKHAYRATWYTLYGLIGFQLYVNVWAFWDLNWPRAIASGAVFPLTVGAISYINMLRQQQVDKQQRERKERTEKMNRVLGAESTADLALIAEERPFDGTHVEKALVIKAFDEDPSELSKKRFAGASNWRSVKRWWKKLTNGEKP